MNINRLRVIFLSCIVSIAPVYAALPHQRCTPNSASAHESRINLNTADVRVLTHSFKGIGKKRAEAIVAYREANGGFHSVSELSQIRGLGLNFVKRYLPQLEAVFVVK